MPQDDGKGPSVVIDQTQQDGISAAEIQRIAKERRDKLSREATTSVIEIPHIPKKKSSLPLVVFLAVFAIAAIALVIKSQHEPDAGEAIPPVSAATLSQEPSIPAVPTSITTATEAITSAAPAAASATAPAQAMLPVAHSASAHAPAPVSSAGGPDDPDKALFKTHRTP